MAAPEGKGDEIDVFVIGSSNMDLVVTVDRMPAVGETIHGNTFSTHFGGKGANQAVSARLLGAKVEFMTKLGKDEFGDKIFKHYSDMGMSTRLVLRDDETATGIATITVDSKGSNSIVIVGGANNKLTADEVEAQRPTFERTRVVVCQLEIPDEATYLALKVGRDAGAITVFNPAPAKALPKEVYPTLDILVVNETEAQLMTGIEVTGTEDAATAGEELLKLGVQTAVIVTLGAGGSFVLERGGKGVHVPAAKADAVVDTTGAGDCFLGSLAAHIAHSGKFTMDAVAFASKVAAVSVTAPGAQSSYPSAADLDPSLRLFAS